MINKIELTDDMLKLISCIHFQDVPSVPMTEEDITNQNSPIILTYGIDYASFYGGTFILEDIAYILGRYDEVIPGTEESYDGPHFPDDVEEYFINMHNYIIEHIEEIEELVHQFSIKGGLVPGTYVSKNNRHYWELKNKN